MDVRLESFCDGYAKAIQIFPDSEEGIRSDWENVGRDIGVSLKKYKISLDTKSCQTPKKRILRKKKKGILPK